jgi:hypothetical protein
MLKNEVLQPQNEPNTLVPVFFFAELSRAEDSINKSGSWLVLSPTLDMVSSNCVLAPSLMSANLTPS